MKLINESYFDEEEFRYNTLEYNIDSEVLVMQYIDGQDCYAIGIIDMITITRDGIQYSIEDSTCQVSKKDIMPYSTENENKLLNKGYVAIKPYQIM